MSTYIEVQFKGNRRLPYLNPMAFPVRLGDTVIVEAEKGEDIGRVVQITEVDRISSEDSRESVPSILRKAGPHDHQRLMRNEERETKAEETCRELIREHRLRMKLVNVEFQLDGKKVTFFFTAEGRVDFRHLVKDLASRLRTRIDLRQIGARDEAKKFGGYGPCGQKQCCSSFLPRFDPITTSMAKAQNLPLNPTKLSGNCGRLKCCLRYELDFYKSEFARYPNINTAVETLKGLAFVDKIDIFHEEVVIRYKDGDMDSISRQELMDLLAFKPGAMNCKSGCGAKHERKAPEGADNRPAPSEEKEKRPERRSSERREAERRSEERRVGQEDSRENPEERRQETRRGEERRARDRRGERGRRGGSRRGGRRGGRNRSPRSGEGRSADRGQRGQGRAEE